MHTTADSCWLSLLGQVYDVTRLLQEQDWGALAAPMLAAAGTDVSHWFNPDTGDVETHVDPESNLETYYTPQVKSTEAYRNCTSGQHSKQ